jgi:hypothetical protein
MGHRKGGEGEEMEKRREGEEERDGEYEEKEK